ncbi:MAG: hypothetical protein Tsb0020_23130 [Haliangiales bacterium]
MGHVVAIAAATALSLASATAHAQVARPGPGNGYDADIELLSFDSSAGNFRIWYVLGSDDAVPATDTAPADGVPDYVANAALIAEQSRAIFVEQYGFRAPLVDAELLPAEQVGGDARLDIYLIDFGAADGAFVRDQCVTEGAETEGAEIERCAGHLLVENDFDGSDYGSLELGLQVVVSHEYFHAVQSAYDSRQDLKWTEGSAVWAEELAYPAQDDYERLIAGFLNKPFRAFERPTGPSFGDPYPYGTALWATFLSESFGVDIIRDIWEACEGGVYFTDAAAAILARDYDTTLSDAWLAFTRWNLFTGTRADPDRAYRDSASWASVALEPALVGDRFDERYAIDGLSARYVPVELPTRADDAAHLLSISAESLAGVVASAYLWDGATLRGPFALSPEPDDSGEDERASLALSWSGAPTLYVVISGVTAGLSSRRVTLAMSEPPATEPEPPDEPGLPGDPDPPDEQAPITDPPMPGGRGCQASPAPLDTQSSLASLLPLMLALLGLRARRRGAHSHARPLAVTIIGAALCAAAAATAQPADSLPEPTPSGHVSADASGAGEQDLGIEHDVERTVGREDERKPTPEPQAAPGGDEIIVVTGSRVAEPVSQTTTATEVITRDEITASGATNVAELLATHPGVELIPTLRGASVRIQGLDPKYVSVLVDGRRVIGRIDGALDLEGIAVGDIERVEIVKGASSALYGSDALGGVIHIITRKPDQPLSGEARAQYGSLGSADLYAAAGAALDRWRGRISAGWRRGDGYDLTPESPDTTAHAYRETALSLTASHDLGGLVIDLSGEYLRRDLNGVDEVPAGAEMALYDLVNAIEHASATADGRWRSGSAGAGRGSMRYSLYRDQFLQDQRGSGDGDRYQETTQQLGEVSLQQSVALGAHQLIAGAEAAVEHLDGERISAGASARYRLAGLVQDDWQLRTSPFVRVAAGARVDLDSQFGVHATPKLALRWDPHPRVVARASYGMGYRAPDFKELYLEFDNPGVGYRVRGNPDLQPETSHSVNASLEVRPHAQVWAAISGYYNDVDNLITTDLVSEGDPGQLDQFGYVNAASAYTRGLESRLRLSALGGLSVDLSYTFTDTRDRTLDRALPGRARHRGAVTAGYRRGATEASVRARAVGARRFHQSGDAGDDAVTTDPYIHLDVRAARTLFARVTAFAGVMNVLDAGDAQYAPIAPRTVYGGARVTY